MSGTSTGRRPVYSVSGAAHPDLVSNEQLAAKIDKLQETMEVQLTTMKSTRRWIMWDTFTNLLFLTAVVVIGSIVLSQVLDYKGIINTGLTVANKISDQIAVLTPIGRALLNAAVHLIDDLHIFKGTVESIYNNTMLIGTCLNCGFPFPPG